MNRGDYLLEIEQRVDALAAFIADIRCEGYKPPKEPTFTVEPRKKAKKRWIGGQRYKRAPIVELDSCHLCIVSDSGMRWQPNGIGILCHECTNADIWKLAMPKSHPLDLDNLPKGFTGERWLVEYSKNGNDWFKCIWDRKDQIEIDTMRLWIQYGTEYRYTKKAPK